METQHVVPPGAFLERCNPPPRLSKLRRGMSSASKVCQARPGARPSAPPALECAAPKTNLERRSPPPRPSKLPAGFESLVRVSQARPGSRPNALWRSKTLRSALHSGRVRRVLEHVGTLFGAPRRSEAPSTRRRCCRRSLSPAHARALLRQRAALRSAQHASLLPLRLFARARAPTSAGACRQAVSMRFIALAALPGGAMPAPSRRRRCRRGCSPARALLCQRALAMRRSPGARLLSLRCEGAPCPPPRAPPPAARSLRRRRPLRAVAGPRDAARVRLPAGISIASAGLTPTAKPKAEGSLQRGCGRWTAGRCAHSLVRGHFDRFSGANPNG